MSFESRTPAILRTGCAPHLPVDPDLSLLDAEDRDPQASRQLRAWLRIQQLLALEPELAVRELARFGDPARLLTALAEKGRVAESDEVEAAVETLRRIGATALPILASAYPRRLSALQDAPPLLLLVGAGARDPSFLTRPCVGIVGARAPSAYGLRVAHRLGWELGRAGVVVVSGMARGIDAAAHRGALRGGGLTLAVQACGPEKIYPGQHRKLAREIAERGLVMTEMPPGTPPRGPYFPLRNRIISALSRVVVVVEARLRSGSLITARHALDQGGDVMAVPGPVDVATSDGPNALIRDGAAPVLEAADVLRWIGVEAREQPDDPVASPAEEGAEADAPAGPVGQLDPEAGRLLARLVRAPATHDELLRSLDWAPERLSMRLLELELEGRALIDRDGRWHAAGRR